MSTFEIMIIMILPLFAWETVRNDQKWHFCTKCWGLFPEANYRHFKVSNGNYGPCLKARLRNLIYLVFLALFGNRGGQKLIFFNYVIYYHVIPQNVLIFFQKSKEWVCLSKFSFFGPFYVHFGKIVPKSDIFTKTWRIFYL